MAQCRSSTRFHGEDDWLKTLTIIPAVPLLEPLDAGFKASKQIPQERLALIIKQEGDETWSMVGRMPNLAYIESSNATFQQAFASQRSYIDDSAKSHFAPRYFAINRQDVVFKNWPRPNRSILRFEPSPIGLSDVLDDTCSLPDISNALFRLRDDGTGIYVKSKVLRPGESYVLVRKNAASATTYVRESKRVAITCNGVHGLSLDVPNRISELYHDAVKPLGLSVALALQVRPAGYPPKSWDEDGIIEWFEGSPKV